jgi:hypothetical protein
MFGLEIFGIFLALKMGFDVKEVLELFPEDVRLGAFNLGFEGGLLASPNFGSISLSPHLEGTG